MGGLLNAMDDSFDWKWQLRGNCGKVSCTWGIEFSIGSCIPSKYMNQGKLSGSSFHQKSLPYRLNHFFLTIHSRSHGLGPWVTKIIYGFCWIFNGLCVGLNIHRALMLILLTAYPLAWPRFLLHVLWPNQVWILFFFLIIIIISFFFLLFGTLGLHGPS